MIAELLVVAQIVATAPPLPPAEAAAVMARLDSPSNRTFAVSYPPGPTVVIVGSSPSAGPFGEFPKMRPTAPLARDSGLTWINGYPVSPQGLEHYAVLSGALNSQGRPR